MTSRQFPVEDSLAVLIRQCVFDLLNHHHEDASICPSEAARMLGDELNVEWRDLMRPVRDIIQQGKPVSIHEARGPVRLRLRRQHQRGR